MLSGTVPFKGNNNIKELHQLILKGSAQTISDISEEANHLIQSLLEIDPKKRITIPQILSHPWLITVNTKNKSKSIIYHTYNIYSQFIHKSRKNPFSQKQY